MNVQQLRKALCESLEGNEIAQQQSTRVINNEPGSVWKSVIELTAIMTLEAQELASRDLSAIAESLGILPLVTIVENNPTALIRIRLNKKIELLK